MWLGILGCCGCYTFGCRLFCGGLRVCLDVCFACCRYLRRDWFAVALLLVWFVALCVALGIWIVVVDCE